ncbi:MAG: acyl-CoA desaturase [Cytophagales bacterium]|nr:acyl-CoA desaturase [Cytophagales bacterium]
MELKFTNQEDRDFVRKLNKRVSGYFASNDLKKQANAWGWTKAALLLSAYLLSYVGLYYQNAFPGLLFCFGILGALKIFLALNVAHDAAHQSFASNKNVNHLLLKVFDFLGASSHIWQMRHIAHHAFTNIADHDVDIKQSWLVRIFPSSPLRKIHQFQHVYMFFLYGIYTINWLILRDIRDTWNFNGSNDHERLSLRVSALFTKAMYLIMMVLLPASVLDFSLGQVITGFLVMHLTASYTVASVLASTHVGLAAAFPIPNEKGVMPHSYERHQLLTTVDFATNNPIITQLYGGFNHHVVHHLFPNVCHVHYPKLTAILIDTCQEYHMPYKSNRTMWQAIQSHWHLLKQRGQQGLNLSLPEF